MNIVDRVRAPKPKLFRVLRSVGLALAAVGGVLITAPVALPAAVVTLGGYLTVSGAVLSAVCQVTVDDNTQNKKMK
ncbi:hypothetical protein E2P86_08940 [Sphingobacterium psychroaquaticum]|uniref:hypothetical protein n=1 Tax=Sphingobacterium psychroaquaticum TaxID=561061 RepID=UPI001069CD90|nr:hypothetical protein [Sphingobacterium psychroaquaticum]QBQ41274.1 hypothetical protein E2P86_08940 [Sphingobacterium psychroaquaticum]